MRVNGVDIIPLLLSRTKSPKETFLFIILFTFHELCLGLYVLKFIVKINNYYINSGVSTYTIEY